MDVTVMDVIKAFSVLTSQLRDQDSSVDRVLQDYKEMDPLVSDGARIIHWCLIDLKLN